MLFLEVENFPKTYFSSRSIADHSCERYIFFGAVAHTAELAEQRASRENQVKTKRETESKSSGVQWLRFERGESDNMIVREEDSILANFNHDRKLI